MDEFSQEMQKPFDRFLANPNLAMLNSALPYVGEVLRKPLALYIKLMEINRIMSDFDKEEVLSACGFEENQPNLEAMLKAMKIAGGKDASPQLDSMLNMLNLIHMYQSCMDLMQNNPELVSLLSGLMNQKEGSSSQGDSLQKLLPFLMAQQNQGQGSSDASGQQGENNMMEALSEFLRRQQS